MPLVQAEHLVKTFSSGQSVFGTATSARIRAVNDVSRIIEAGETLGLVGNRLWQKYVRKNAAAADRAGFGDGRFDGRDVLAARGSELRRLRRDRTTSTTGSAHSTRV